jgi:hypothetical protein
MSESDPVTQLMGPNYELVQIASIPVWKLIEESGGMPVDKGVARLHDLSLGGLYFAVAKDSTIYVGVPPRRYRAFGGGEAFSLSRVLKISKEGRIAGVIKGGHHRMGMIERTVWRKYLADLKASGSGFFYLNGLETDDRGALYILDHSFWEGCVSICQPGSNEAKLLDLDWGALRFKNLIPNPDTGGVVVQVWDDHNNPKYYVELYEGKVVKRELPRFYLKPWTKRQVLELHHGRATLWQVAADVAEDRQTIKSCELDVLGSFYLDLRAPTRNVNCIGESEEGRVFDVRFETGGDGQRAVFFWAAGQGYGGHLIPPEGTMESAKLVGRDGKYYEFATDPKSDILRIYRAKRVIELVPDP